MIRIFRVSSLLFVGERGERSKRGERDGRDREKKGLSGRGIAEEDRGRMVWLGVGFGSVCQGAANHVGAQSIVQCCRAGVSQPALRSTPHALTLGSWAIHAHTHNSNKCMRTTRTYISYISICTSVFTPNLRRLRTIPCVPIYHPSRIQQR